MMKKKMLIALAILLSVIAGRKLLTGQYFHIHDNLHIFRANEFTQCFKDGQIPCRWSKNLGKGYGYPVFIFYPPIIYAIPSLLNSLGLSFVTSFNLLSFLMFPLAAYSMYKLIKTTTDSDIASFVGSAMYTLYPYHATNVFVRGVYAETFAWSILPLVFATTYNSIKKDEKFSPIIPITLLFLSHIISAMLFYPLTILWALLLLIDIRKKKNFKTKLKTTIINLLLPLGLSAFFFLPAMLEKSLVQSDSMIINYYLYIVHFITLAQLFIHDTFGYGGSSWGLDDGMSFMIGKPYWILFILSLGFLVYKNRKSFKNLIEPIPLITFIGAPIALFLTHSRSTPIWKLIPPLQYLQFPWRFLGVAGFLMIFAVTYSISKLKKKHLKYFLLFPLLLLYLYLPFFKPEKYLEHTDQTFLNGRLTNEQKESHLYDYMPTSVNQVPAEISSSPIYESDSIIENFTLIKWNSNTLEIELTQENEGSVSFSVFDYPGWTAYLDSSLVSHYPHSTSGLITLDIPSGTHRVKLSLTDTPTRKVANYISLVSLALFIYLLKSRENTS